ncbi:hypothetical protein D3C73_1555660 [compost metagenome]
MLTAPKIFPLSPALAPIESLTAVKRSATPSASFLILSCLKAACFKFSANTFLAEEVANAANP